MDKALSRSLKQLFWAGVFDDPSNCEWAAIPAAAINSTAHQAAVKDVGLQSMVLLRSMQRDRSTKDSTIDINNRSKEKMKLAECDTKCPHQKRRAHSLCVCVYSP